MTMDRMTYEREMTDGWRDYAAGEKPKFSDGPYAAGFWAAMHAETRNPKRFLVGWKQRGIGPKQPPRNTNIRVVSEEYERATRSHSSWNSSGKLR